MITGGQVRAARGLLDLSQEGLARGAAVSLSTLKRFEAGRYDQMRGSSIARIRQALEGAGVRFIDEAAGRGVLLRVGGHDARHEVGHQAHNGASHDVWHEASGETSMKPTQRHGAGQATFNKLTEDRIARDGAGGDGLHRSAADAAERGETPELARAMQAEADAAHAEGRSADQGDGGPGRVEHARVNPAAQAPVEPSLAKPS